MSKPARVWTGSAWVDLLSAGTNPHMVVPFGKPGSLTTTVTSMPYVFTMDALILGVSAAVGTAPTGAAILIDVNKNGTTIFTTQANRPSIPAGAYVTSPLEVTSMDIATFTAGDVLTVNIDQIGSSVAGADLTVEIRYQNLQ